MGGADRSREMSKTKAKIVAFVVDDDPAVRDALRFSLELQGLTAHTCSSGEGLLAHQALAESDCIVLDYKMPGMNGLDVLEELAAREVTTPVIFMTGPLTDALRRRALNAGARLVLEKPLLDTLPDRIRDLIR
ncbi:MAG: response regulator [Pseudomonadota bacterium]